MKKQRILILLIAIAIMLSSCGKTDPAADNTDNANLGSFETIDLQGNDINQDIFMENDITMVNIWATWCPPCVGEMPALGKLNNQLPSNVGLIGICTDAKDEADSAKEIMKTSNATFTVLIPTDSMEAGFLSTVDAIPTTIFVDSEGNIVGSRQLGAPGSDEDDIINGYLNLIENALNQ